jgi:hypothetical protein
MITGLPNSGLLVWEFMGFQWQDFEWVVIRQFKSI